MPKVYNWQGKRYTAGTVQDAPVEFLLSLVESGELDGAGVLAAERAGKGRVTLITALEAKNAAADEEEE